MHIKAHRKVSSELEEGNMLVDREAKDAAKGEVPDETVEAALIPDGKISIEGQQEILRLLDAVQLPERVAIMHIKAHRKVSSELEEGNMLVDREAKDAAKGEVPDETVEAALIPDGKISIEDGLIVVMNMIRKVVGVVVIVVVIAGANAIPRKCNVTGIYQCQGKVYDSHSRKALNKLLKITNASLWEGRDVWGCNYAFIQDGFNEAYHPPMKLIWISPECCDKCLTKCPEFRLKIEGCAIRGYDLDFNITQVCTEYHEDKAKTTPIVPRKIVTTQMPAIPEEEEEPIVLVVTRIGSYAIKKTGNQRLLINPEWSLKRVEMGMQINALTSGQSVPHFSGTPLWIGLLSSKNVCPPISGAREISLDC
ncbi:hypothetical protein HGM15179_020028 [Zosterops borbonicus]|uniref:RNase H type-1 domain-containing protein n=1 Tax=Zosterops borbonicus TaxID=364589 RepID=A0A8K1D8I8_9PASS|nr:hypothetical protein HGM15179_020028 [Zosterops borbonicus]